MRRSSFPSCLSKTKRSCPSSSSPGRYLYEYELWEDNNSIVYPPKNTVLPLVSTARINLRVNYILRTLSGDDVDESTLERCFYMRSYLISGFEDYARRVYSRELCQPTGGDAEYEVNQPELLLSRFFRHLRIERTVSQKLIGDTKDFVRSSSRNRVVPIAVSIKVYTLQQEDESIDDAKRRAKLVGADDNDNNYVNWLIELVERPPPYKFRIQFNDDRHEMLREDCSICLSKLSVGDEVLLLSCSHAYHYDCVIRWGKECPMCRRPTNFRAMRLIQERR